MNDSYNEQLDDLSNEVMDSIEDTSDTDSDDFEASFSEDLSGISEEISDSQDKLIAVTDQSENYEEAFISRIDEMSLDQLYAAKDEINTLQQDTYGLGEYNKEQLQGMKDYIDAIRDADDNNDGAGDEDHARVLKLSR